MKRLRSTLLTAAITILPIASYAATTPHIGVVDLQKALLESHAAQNYAKSSRKAFQPKLDKLAKERDQIKAKEEKLKKNSLSLSKKEMEKQQTTLDNEKKAFFEQLQSIRMEKEQADQKELKRLEPQLKEAVDTVAKEKHYSLIIDKSAIVYQHDDSDITSKVISQLNEITQKSKKTNAK